MLKAESIRPSQHEHIPTNFKRSGDLESKGLAEPLPPTPISEEAQKELETWGLTPESIIDLRNFNSIFRFDQSEHKIAGLSSVEIYSNGGVTSRWRLFGYYESMDYPD